jgi:hypothetical protein
VLFRSFYADHLRLLDHWRGALPLPIVEVRYERLVTAPEAELRRVLDGLDLAWDPAVLRFHELREVAHTASYAQVRRPLHAGAVGRAADLGARLVSLRAGLAGGPPPPDDRPSDDGDSG